MTSLRATPSRFREVGEVRRGNELIFHSWFSFAWGKKESILIKISAVLSDVQELFPAALPPLNK